MSQPTSPSSRSGSYDSAAFQASSPKTSPVGTKRAPRPSPLDAKNFNGGKKLQDRVQDGSHTAPPVTTPVKETLVLQKTLSTRPSAPTAFVTPIGTELGEEIRCVVAVPGIGKFLIQTRCPKAFTPEEVEEFMKTQFQYLGKFHPEQLNFDIVQMSINADGISVKEHHSPNYKRIQNQLAESIQCCGHYIAGQKPELKAAQQKIAKLVSVNQLASLDDLHPPANIEHATDSCYLAATDFYLANDPMIRDQLPRTIAELEKGSQTEKIKKDIHFLKAFQEHFKTVDELQKQGKPISQATINQLRAAINQIDPQLAPVASAQNQNSSLQGLAVDIIRKFTGLLFDNNPNIVKAYIDVPENERITQTDFAKRINNSFSSNSSIVPQRLEVEIGYGKNATVEIPASIQRNGTTYHLAKTVKHVNGNHFNALVKQGGQHYLCDDMQNGGNPKLLNPSEFAKEAQKASLLVYLKESSPSKEANPAGTASSVPNAKPTPPSLSTPAPSSSPAPTLSSSQVALIPRVKTQTIKEKTTLTIYDKPQDESGLTQDGFAKVDINPPKITGQGREDLYGSLKGKVAVVSKSFLQTEGMIKFFEKSVPQKEDLELRIFEDFPNTRTPKLDNPAKSKTDTQENRLILESDEPTPVYTSFFSCNNRFFSWNTKHIPFTLQSKLSAENPVETIYIEDAINSPIALEEDSLTFDIAASKQAFIDKLNEAQASIVAKSATRSKTLRLIYPTDDKKKLKTIDMQKTKQAITSLIKSIPRASLPYIDKVEVILLPHGLKHHHSSTIQQDKAHPLVHFDILTGSYEPKSSDPVIDLDEKSSFLDSFRSKEKLNKDQKQYIIEKIREVDSKEKVIIKMKGQFNKDTQTRLEELVGAIQSGNLGVKSVEIILTP